MTTGIVAVVPAFNEGTVIRTHLESLRPFVDHIICVDDGSTDDTGKQALIEKVTVLTHLVNLGQGAALSTGLRYALTLPTWQYLVTFDADGQHNPEEIPAMVAPLAAGTADVVLGSRFLTGGSEVPFMRRTVLKAGVIFSRLTARVKVTDAHNGFRAFNRRAVQSIRITQSGMAHASEILHEIHAHRLRYVEVPTTITYTEYSRGKGQSSLNAVNIVFDMFQRGTR